MTADHQRDVTAILQAALTREGASRSEFLDGACLNDPSLRAQIETLLMARQTQTESAGSRLVSPDTPAQPAPEETLTTPPEGGGALSAERIGAYRLLREIGTGGMGVVYEAEQDAPICRRVALKLVKKGMDTKQIVARFESERQALALMSHVNIARIYDGGESPDGRPYFVMEWVRGIPITEYCDLHRLGNPERLRLFLQVCEGVQHAHQKGIIHRDIKPSNVLVAVEDDRPLPKIIDFGIAKAVSQPLTKRSLFTELGELVGTPEYMSPEQAEMSSLDIDTRSDVYSLGVLLYQLLAGALPFDPSAMRKAGLDGMRRMIREEEPPRPSTRIASLGAGATEAAHNRRTESATLSRQLRGDLDWITMKAIEKDRTRRYGSASELAADIGRHLRHEPVVAGPPSGTYRLKKYMRRHRFGVAAGLLAALAGMVAVAGIGVGLVRARRAEGVAREEAQTAQKVSAFLVDLFEVSDPSESRGSNVTAREILDRGAERIERDLADQPAVQARLMNTIGRIYRRLGRYSAAEAMLRRSLSIRKANLGSDDPSVAVTLNELGHVLRKRGAQKEAEEAYRESLALRRRLYGDKSTEVATALLSLAYVLDGRSQNAEAEPLYREALAIRLEVLGPEHRDVAESMAGLANLLRRKGEYVEAETLYGQALKLQRKLLGEDHPDVALTLHNLGSLHLAKEDPRAAEPFVRASLAIRRKVLGDAHPDLAQSMYSLATIVGLSGSYDEAERLYRESLAMRRQLLGEEHPDVSRCLQGLAELLAEKGDYEAAEGFYREALAMRRRLLGDRHWYVALTLNALGIVREKRGAPAEAEAMFRQALALMRELRGDRHPYVANAKSNLGRVLARRGEYAEAEALVREALATRRELFGGNSDFVAASLSSLSGILEKTGRYAEAEPLHAEAVSILARQVPPDDRKLAEAWSEHGACLVHLQRYDLAEPLLLKSYPVLRSKRGDRATCTIEAARSLVSLYEAVGQKKKAAEYRSLLSRPRQ